MTATSERNIMQIMILDQGIIQFNAKPRDGIAFLIKNKVIPDDPLEIAKFLATTDKLDKHVLGNFLGKDNDFSVAVLNKFASLFHYEGVPFDMALRSFTNRFAMPGESQMIYRILERFSVYYSQSNAEIDKDKALILSYALIMLNVDLHSARVKAKMTKEEFVRNTEMALAGCMIDRAALEDMYIRMLAKEFKPDTTAEEIVYSKLALNPKYANKGRNQSRESVMSVEAVEALKAGAVLLKYGREGSPHSRKVFLSADGNRLCWIDPKKLEKLEKRQIRKLVSTLSAAAKPKKVTTGGGTSTPPRTASGRMAGCVSACFSPPPPPPTSTQPAVDPSSPPPATSDDVSPIAPATEAGAAVAPVTPTSTALIPPPPPASIGGASAVSGPPLLPLKKMATIHPSSPVPKSLRAAEVVQTNNELDIVRATYVQLRARGVQSRESFRREIPLEDITGLVVGTGGTRNFRRHFQHASGLLDDGDTEQRCFSLITDYRTLDLQAPPGVDLTPWLLFFHSVLSQREKRLRALADKNKDIWSFTQKERASLVRWQEIVPQWSDHWNCGARVSAGGGYRASQHPKEELLNHRMFFLNPSGFVLDRGQRLETAVTPHLVALWLEGIPSSVRPIVWPIAVGNDLRIDEKYFTTLLGLLAAAAAGNAAERDTRVNVSMTESSLADLGEVASTPNKTGGGLSIFDPTSAAAGNEGPVAAALSPTSADVGRLKSFEREIERELKSSSMRTFANRALTWIDARGSREQQAFFKPMVWTTLDSGTVGTARRPASALQRSPTGDNRNGGALSLEEDGGGWVGSTKRKSSFDEAAAATLSGMAPVENNSELETAKSEDSWDSNTAPMNNGWENVYNATKILVTCFLAQRRDIKYVRGMGVLASMVIFNVGIQDLARAFTVYSNILHQYYFFDFFTLRWRDMRMRFDLYSKLLRERMPYLEDHFNAIQITSDLYFNQWLLTGFTRVLPFRSVCRVWDGFLLLGESYFFTAALALLNYYEHSLMTSGFGGCLEILLGHADEVLFNDKKFFECVQAQQVSNERFAAWISAQRLAEEKTALYDLLLLM